MFKKKILSVLLIWVVLLASIPCLPTQVSATPCKYDQKDGNGGLLYPYGNWDTPLVYDNDGAYADTVAPYDHNDYSYRTRHVTMFNDCSKNQITYVSGKTQRGNNFSVTDHTEATKAKYPESSDIKYVPLSDTSKAPYTVYHAGCGNSAISNNNWAVFNTLKDGDHRMIFRNYYNTDFTSYNGADNNYPYDTNPGKQGLNIREYDYLEFELYVASGAQMKRSRSVEPKKGYAVYLYYETNDANGHFLNHSSDGWCIEGYENHSKWNFENQLNFDANGNFVDTDKWITIRLPIPDSVKTATIEPTVKQVTIRILGGMAACTNGLQIDDVRFVKNDDHIGYVYPDTTGPEGKSYTAQEYPAGKYYMINDFEYNSYERDATTGQDGVIFPYRYTSDNGSTYSTPGYTIVGRNEDLATDDRFNSHHTGEHNWAKNNTYSTFTGTNFFMAGDSSLSVTQGNFATALNVRNARVYKEGAVGWYLPTYYQRKYQTSMDLSQYTHFAIDVYVRTVNYNGLCRPSGSNAKGVTFNIALFDDYSIQGDDDDYNYTSGTSVKFFLPYGKEPWEVTASDYPDGNKSNFGIVIPLENYRSHQGSNATAYGAMRFIFTREQLISGANTANFDLKSVDGMRFSWLNRNKDDDHRYYSFALSGTDDSTNHPHDIILDNFIAYTPYTDVTIQNSTPTLAGNDADQQFVYQLQGGYVSGDYNYMTSSNTYGRAFVGFDGKTDMFTKNVNTTFSVPANGSVTIKNVPFNSYYVTQQNWPWRYKLSDITANKSDIIKDYRDGMHTASVMPRISFDGSGRRNVSILELMKQRNFTITFHNTVSFDGWLSDETNALNRFN